MKERKEQGITLIALVITIVIMLILAGILIAQLTGENGLISKIAVAKNISDYSTAKEEINLKLNEIIIQCENEGRDYDLQAIIEAIKEDNEKEIAKMFNVETGSIKAGASIVNPSDIVVVVKKYSKYKFLMNDDDGIKGVTTGEITDNTEIDDFKNVEEFEAKTLKITQAVTIKYEANGGKGTMSSTTVGKGEKVKLAKNTYKKEGYAFTGWKDLIGNEYNDEQKIEAKNIILYAQWEELTLASKVKRNPSEYYGKTVNYSANGINSNYTTGDEGYMPGWKVFYADTDNIFLITSDYLPKVKVPSEAKMTTAGTYQTYWQSVPAAQNVTNLNNSFMFTGYNNYNTYNNGKCVSTLLNTSNWSKFVNSDYADYAIGSPTLEMWISSWNRMYPNDMLYCNNTNSYGYFLGITENETEKYISSEFMSGKSGYSNILYYPYTDGHKNGTELYWLASPSNAGTNQVMTVFETGGIGPDSYTYTLNRGTIRPVVRLNNNVILTDYNKGSCDYGLKIK